MNCVEFAARLHPFVDGELSVDDTAAAQVHVVECPHCAALIRREQAFRRLLREQPREVASPEFRARLVQAIRREARRDIRRAWLAVPAFAAAALVLAILWPAWRAQKPLVAELVDKHIAYAQLERPAELASGDPREVADWLRQRAGMQVPVPDYSPSGIHLIGARLAEAQEHRAAYLLYEKGRTLLSVFMLSVRDADGALRGSRVSYRGQDYRTEERKGYHTVTWADGRAVFGLVSSLDYDALLECADRLRTDTTRL